MHTIPSRPHSAASKLTQVLLCIAGWTFACGGSSGSTLTDTTPAADGGPRGVEPAGQACTVATQCYEGLRNGDGGASDGAADGGGASGAIVGTVTCITKVTNGYCTHTCAQDTDCCAVAGECRTAVNQVCAPLENQGGQYCFLSCEDDDIARAVAANADAGYYNGGATDAGSKADAYCRSYAGESTTCRSTGGGSKNRKVCLPKS